MHHTYLGHLFTVSLRVEGSLSQKDGMLLRGYTKLVVESVMPDLLHVIPVGDDTMFNRVFEGKDTSLGLGLISNIGILLTHTNHDTLEKRVEILKKIQQLRFCTALQLTWCLGRPTMDGNTALGASSPAKPALHIPEPLSTTKAATSSSHMLDYLISFKKTNFLSR